ncbi:hypothetical protein [Flavobacterium luteum]|uniref:Uncharacterized protein n=1 Tax=Flavobacterium luteum TaxID=2026654 RepID=A0A7J5AH22_9FLAO|nr:hypothetical protein [Flavobacterium luteum]KAB1156922.1 hypothetical protein F6464_06115 [Flavobacterium luteum]
MKIKPTKQIVVHFLCTVLSLLTINSIYAQSCTPTSKQYALVNLVGASQSGTTLTKTSELGWKNAGGSTNLILSEGHYITYKVLPGKGVVVGLSVSDRDLISQQ